MMEAICTKCDETFIPHDECCKNYCFCRGPLTVSVTPAHCADHCLTFVHGQTEDGEECGGKGEILGEWEPQEPDTLAEARYER